MFIEWDDTKNTINQKKHGVSFEIASRVFEDPFYIEIFDYKHSEKEDRFIALGMVCDVLYVVFTEIQDGVRIISARVATRREKEVYYDRTIHP